MPDTAFTVITVTEPVGKAEKNRFLHKNMSSHMSQCFSYYNPLSATVLKECLIRTYSMTLPDAKSYRKSFSKIKWGKEESFRY